MYNEETKIFKKSRTVNRKALERFGSSIYTEFLISRSKKSKGLIFNLRLEKRDFDRLTG